MAKGGRIRLSLGALKLSRNGSGTEICRYFSSTGVESVTNSASKSQSVVSNSHLWRSLDYLNLETTETKLKSAVSCEFDHAKLDSDKSDGFLDASEAVSCQLNVISLNGPVQDIAPPAVVPRKSAFAMALDVESSGANATFRRRSLSHVDSGGTSLGSTLPQASTESDGLQGSTWKRYFDPTTQRFFYCCSATGTTQWEPPSLTVMPNASVAHAQSPSHDYARVYRQLQTAKRMVQEERVFVASLDELLSNFVAPIEYLLDLGSSVVEPFDTVEIALVFSNLRQIRMLSQQLVLSIEDVLQRSEEMPSDKDLGVGEVFRQLMTMFQVHARYAEHLASSRFKLRKSLPQHASTSEFLQSCKTASHRASSLSFFELLELPQRRIEKYVENLEHQIVQTSENSNERAALQTAAEFLQDCRSYIFETLNQVSNIDKLKEIQATFTGKVSLVAPYRKFIMQGVLEKANRRGDQEELMFHLFNDMLLYSEITSKGLFTLRRKLPLESIAVLEANKNPGFGYAFVIQSDAKSFFVFARTEHERDLWMREINKSALHFKRRRRSSAVMMIEMSKNVNDDVEKLGLSQTLGSDSLLRLSMNAAPLSEESQSNSNQSIELPQTTAPLWDHDFESMLCKRCNEKFTLLNRRHHCRKCGRLVCGKCSPFKCILPNINASKPQRICSTCYELLCDHDRDKNNDKIEDMKPLDKTATTAATDQVSLLNFLHSMGVEQRASIVLTPQRPKEIIERPQRIMFRARTSLTSQALLPNVVRSPLNNREESIVKRLRIAHELVETELTYVSTLDHLLRGFIRPVLRSFIANDERSVLISAISSDLRVPSNKARKDMAAARRSSMSRSSGGDSMIALTHKELLKQRKMAALSDTLEQILTLSCKLLVDLQTQLEVWDPDHLAFGRIFVDVGELFKIYAQYGTLHAATLPWFLCRHELQEFNGGDELNLQSSLITPIQRVPRYLMLLRELKKETDTMHPDRLPLEKAETTLMISVNYLNETIRVYENRLRVIQVQKLFIGNVELATGGRQLLLEGSLCKINRTGQSVRYHFHLFDDMLMYSDATAIGFKLKRKIALVDCIINDMEEEEVNTLKFQVCSSSKSFTAVANSREDKIRWISSLADAIKRIKEGCSNPIIGAASPLFDAKHAVLSLTDSSSSVNNTFDTKQRTHISALKAPVWQLDSSSTACVFCDSKFSIMNRRHHCRKCGSLVCNKCSLGRMVVEAIHITKPQRVCDRCIESSDKEMMNVDASEAVAKQLLQDLEGRRANRNEFQEINT